VQQSITSNIINLPHAQIAICVPTTVFFIVQMILDPKATVVNGEQLGVTEKGDSSFYIKVKDINVAQSEMLLLKNAGKNITSESKMAHEIPRKVTLVRTKAPSQDETSAGNKKND